MKNQNKCYDFPLRRRSIAPRGFNLVEMLIALVITATLLAATMAALHASFIAYQRTTEVASSHTVSRLVLDRISAMIRNGQDFLMTPLADPLPPNVVETTQLNIFMPDNMWISIRIEIDPTDSTREVLYYYPDPIATPTKKYVLLENIVPQIDPDTSEKISPFTLEYDQYGRTLYRATIDFLLEPDDNQSVMLDGDNVETLHLVATVMPRRAAFDN